jgi:Skp family chaperone for outer membrane proteins
MKKLTVVLSLIAFFVLTAHVYALSVGYVDIEKVFDQYEGTKKAKDKLKKEVDAEQAALEKETNSIKKTMDDLDKKSSIMDKKELQKQKDDLQDRYEKLKLKTVQVQQDLMAKEKEMTANLVDEIRAIIVKISKDKKSDYVFEKNTLLFGGEDITYLVIKQINEQ